MNQELHNAIKVLAKYLQDDQEYFKQWQKNITTSMVVAFTKKVIVLNEKQIMTFFEGAGLLLGSVIAASQIELGWTHNPEISKAISQRLKDELELLSPPGDTIIDTLEVLGIDLPLFSIQMGFAPDATDALVKGETLITEEIATKLEKVLNIDAQFWLNLEANYREKLRKLQSDNAKD